MTEMIQEKYLTVLVRKGTEEETISYTKQLA